MADALTTSFCSISEGDLLSGTSSTSSPPAVPWPPNALTQAARRDERQRRYWERLSLRRFWPLLIAMGKKFQIQEDFQLLICLTT